MEVCWDREELLKDGWDEQKGERDGCWFVGKVEKWVCWGKNNGFGGQMGVLGDPNNPAQVNIPPKTAQATIPPEKPCEPTEYAKCCGTNSGRPTITLGYPVREATSTGASSTLPTLCS